MACIQNIDPALQAKIIRLLIFFIALRKSCGNADKLLWGEWHSGVAMGIGRFRDQTHWVLGRSPDLGRGSQWHSSQSCRKRSD